MEKAAILVDEEETALIGCEGTGFFAPGKAASTAFARPAHLRRPRLPHMYAAGPYDAWTARIAPADRTTRSRTANQKVAEEPYEAG
jgi:hypothetical protein